MSESHPAMSMTLGTASLHWHNFPPGPSACSNSGVFSVRSHHFRHGEGTSDLQWNWKAVWLCTGQISSHARRAWGGGGREVCPDMALVGSLGARLSRARAGWCFCWAGACCKSQNCSLCSLCSLQQSLSSSFTYTLRSPLQVAMGPCPALWERGLVLATLLLLLFLLMFVICDFSSW